MGRHEADEPVSPGGLQEYGSRTLIAHWVDDPSVWPTSPQGARRNRPQLGRTRRQWEQAAESQNNTDEAKEFQSVGLQSGRLSSRSRRPLAAEELVAEGAQAPKRNGTASGLTAHPPLGLLGPSYSARGEGVRRMEWPQTYSPAQWENALEFMLVPNHARLIASIVQGGPVITALHLNLLDERGKAPRRRARIYAPKSAPGLAPWESPYG